MAEREKKKTSAFKKFFSWGKKEEKPEDEVTQGAPGNTDLDFSYYETARKALGSFPLTKAKQAPGKEESAEKASPANADSSPPLPHDHSDIETDEGDVVSHNYADFAGIACRHFHLENGAGREIDKLPGQP